MGNSHLPKTQRGPAASGARSPNPKRKSPEPNPYRRRGLVPRRGVDSPSLPSPRDGSIRHPLGGSAGPGLAWENHHRPSPDKYFIFRPVPARDWSRTLAPNGIAIVSIETAYGPPRAFAVEIFPVPRRHTPQAFHADRIPITTTALLSSRPSTPRPTPPPTHPRFGPIWRTSKNPSDRSVSVAATAYHVPRDRPFTDGDLFISPPGLRCRIDNFTPFCGPPPRRLVVGSFLGSRTVRNGTDGCSTEDTSGGRRSDRVRRRAFGGLAGSPLPRYLFRLIEITIR